VFVPPPHVTAGRESAAGDESEEETDEEEEEDDDDDDGSVEEPVCIACLYFSPASMADSFHLGKGKGLGTCYNATYMSQTHEQQHFTISEVAADWNEPVVPQHIMWPSIARANEQLDPQCS